MTSRSKPGTRPVSGILLVDKPSGETSNRTLQRIRRLFQAEKAGHTGTLDPLATGMLPVCFGSATRVSGLMLAASKRYRVTARFGSATDTGDAAGMVVSRAERSEPNQQELSVALDSLRGPISQVPPMYSALKFRGRRLHELARAGQVVPRPPRSVHIFQLDMEVLAWPDMVLHVHCSKGTYVRSLIIDLAAALDSVAHVTALRRLAVGPFQEEQMRTLETIEATALEGTASLDELLLGVDLALQDRPPITVSHAEATRLSQGQRVSVAGAVSGGSVRVYSERGVFVGLGELGASGELIPRQIFLR